MFGTWEFWERSQIYTEAASNRHIRRSPSDSPTQIAPVSPTKVVGTRMLLSLSLYVGQCDDDEVFIIVSLVCVWKCENDAGRPHALAQKLYGDPSLCAAEDSQKCIYV